MWHLWMKYITITAFIVIDGYKMKPAQNPLVPENPFIVFWNVPTEPCQQRFNVNLNLAAYGILANPHETLSGSVVTLFHHNNLGYYPHVNGLGNAIHGGVPQNQDLSKHLTKVKADIEKAIPMKMFKGLGVIDWEHWRPLWVWNWDDKNIYRSLSIDQVQKRHPNWDANTIQTTAKEEFETAARRFINSTLFLAKQLRPHGLWGYYPFPECYKHNYKTQLDAYTGECPTIEKERNGQLIWLWKQSSALYPSVYLAEELKSSQDAANFAWQRVAEALRMAAHSSDDYDMPVFVYMKPVYTNTTDVLTEEDLVHTIGESAAMGTAGVVLWESSLLGNSKNFCVLLRDYVAGPLGRYVVNVTAATRICSQYICLNHGKCVRKLGFSDAYLHLPYPSFKIQIRASRLGKRVYVKGGLSDKDIAQWRKDFMCQCFLGWTGFFCEIPCSHKKGHVGHY